MRALIDALTTRGKTFLAIGCAAAVSGFALGEADLLRIGILLMMLPLLSALGATRARYRLSCTRQLLPRRVAAGRPAEVRIRLSNISRLRTGLLLAEDTTPLVAGSRQRFVLDAIEANGHRDLSYRVQLDQRGKYTIGPLQIRVADVFGLVAIGRSFSTKSTLVVTPTITPLPRVTIPGSRLGDGESGMRTVAAAGEDDIAPRAYRDGDELRRVHWRSTARYGELMVRREEQQWHNRALLLIDARRRAYTGSGPGSPFEFAVSAAASIGVHLASQGIDTRLVTDSGEVTPAGPAAESLLERLVGDPADAQHRPRPGPGHVAGRHPRAGHRGNRDAGAQPGPAARRQSPGHGPGHGGDGRRAAVGFGPDCAGPDCAGRPRERRHGRAGHPGRGGVAGRGRHGRHRAQRGVAGTAQPGHGRLPAPPPGQHRGARGARRGFPGDRGPPLTAVPR